MPANLADSARMALQKKFSDMLTYPITHLSANNKIVAELSNEQLDFLIKQRKKLIELLSADNLDTAEYMSKMLIGYLLSKNQFLTIGQNDKLELVEIYKSELAAFVDIIMRSDDREAIKKYLKTHFARIANFIVNLYKQGKSTNKVDITETVCAQYSPSTQLGILGIDEPDKLMQPILDVGCGKDANLVKYLLRSGIEAYGLDRNAIGNKNIIDADWFEYELKPEFWGTIISQMAFSIHFFHHHLRRDGDPSRFARRYMQLLHSLKKDGCFIYAPGLPFIEQYLPSDQFVVEKKNIDFSEIQDIKEQIQAKNQVFGEIFYSAHVYRK